MPHLEAPAAPKQPSETGHFFLAIRNSHVLLRRVDSAEVSLSPVTAVQFALQLYTRSYLVFV
jgi:hypothetical protein